MRANIVEGVAGLERLHDEGSQVLFEPAVQKDLLRDQFGQVQPQAAEDGVAVDYQFRELCQVVCQRYNGQPVFQFLAATAPPGLAALAGGQDRRDRLLDRNRWSRLR
ncbi:MAG: hypothetical protein Kilf2KO_31460 [Rhodospirillales bacterium]